MAEERFSVEHQQLESRRFVQVLHYERNATCPRHSRTVDNEREAAAMSTSLENAIRALLTDAERNRD